jgi:crotonobetainyl-CoA:carnitine CoA-transferase CaiB-like acyl-CoA transferase
VPGVLESIRVVDFGQYIAGPLAATMLSDQGADVIHVDPPDGPRWKTDADAFLNRGKRRIGLDLKNAVDLAIARRLIERADVAIENFRPGVMDRLGLGAPDMTGRNPRLIYVSLPGFATDDPRAALAAWEGIVAAATGNCRARAGEAPPDWDTSRATYSAIPLASNFAAFLAATSVVMALIARQRTGRGQRIDIPLFDAIFTAIGPAGAYVTERGLHEPLPIDVNGSGTYRCGDGRYIQFDPSNHRFLTWFADAAGISDWGPDLLDIERLTDPAVNAHLHERLRELFLTRSASEWEMLANAAGAVLAMVRTPREWLASTHARQTGAATQVNDPEFGPTWMAGLAVQTGDCPARVRGARHLPDADRAEILAELEDSPEVVAAPTAESNVGPPLDGLRVLDLTQVLAGPTGGRLLAEFGADVIKIHAPQSRVGGGYLNRGKRTILLDVEATEGQKVFWKLVEHADVVIQNFPPGTAERYGIGYEQVRARRPSIIYASLSCYGHGGPWTPGRGYERQGQAVTGIMDRVGDVPAILGPYNLVDIGTGVLTAFAVGLGVFHRNRTGRGQPVYSSLLQTATFHQTPYMLDYAGKVWEEPRGWHALGSGPLQRFYQAQDGWFFLAARSHEAARLSAVLGLPVFDEARLECCFAEQPAAIWVERLRQAGVSAQVVVHLSDLMQDPWVRDHELSVTQCADDVGNVTYPGLSVRLSETPMLLGSAARRPGADAESVLGEIGLTDAIPRLEQKWVLQTTNLPSAW